MAEQPKDVWCTCSACFLGYWGTARESRDPNGLCPDCREMFRRPHPDMR